MSIPLFTPCVVVAVSVPRCPSHTCVNSSAIFPQENYLDHISVVNASLLARLAGGLLPFRQMLNTVDARLILPCQQLSHRPIQTLLFLEQPEQSTVMVSSLLCGSASRSQAPLCCCDFLFVGVRITGFLSMTTG